MLRSCADLCFCSLRDIFKLENFVSVKSGIKWIDNQERKERVSSLHFQIFIEYGPRKEAVIEGIRPCGILSGLLLLFLVSNRHQKVSPLGH